MPWAPPGEERGAHTNSRCGRGKEDDCGDSGGANYTSNVQRAGRGVLAGYVTPVSRGVRKNANSWRTLALVQALMLTTWLTELG
jgi:hypothetical protein